jgi:RNA polymerase sigma factor (sigma-70 family)
MAQESALHTQVSLLARLHAQPGDAQAWRLFVDRYAPRIYAWCRHWQLQDADARDVTQDVLLKLASKMRTFSYDSTGSFRAWLKTLTRHAWTDFLSNRQRKLVLGSGESQVLECLQTVAAGDDLVQQLEWEFDQELLDEAERRVQSRIDSPTWEAFRLTAKEQLAGAEVAGRLGMTVATVFKYKSRVLKMLQDEVRRLEETETA